MNTSTTTAPEELLPGGRQIKLRRTQMLVWSVIAAFLGAAFIAGLYFGTFEANWHVFYLKPWWDHLFTQSWWPVYRHTAFRDIPEPAFATMGVMTLLAKQKYWNRRVGVLRLATAPVVLIALTFTLGVGGTWLLHYGLPASVRTALDWHSAGNLILGFLIGRILHLFWAPVGATIQGHILTRNSVKAASHGRVPAWVKWPLAPPVIRERFMFLYHETMDRTTFRVMPGKLKVFLISAISLVFTLVTALGLLGHYWAGTGHTIPFLYP